MLKKGEIMMKKLFSALLALTLCLSLAACGSKEATPQPSGDGKTFTVGICQLAQHEALDAATKGFRDALEEALPGQVTFDELNASGDIPTCATICNGFAASNVDLIMANATPALQAAVSATQTIPVLGTSVTEYGVALDIENFNGTPGGNVSGTSDLAPLDQQAAMFDELLPEVDHVGILYCSAEANSAYQVEVVKEALESAGKTVNLYTFADSNDVASVTAQACSDCEALYIPTDNTAANCAEAINNVAEPAGIPIIAGEESLCKGCGIATLSIDYYELGRTTGEMAAKILKGEADISEMAVEYYQNPVKKFFAERCEALHIDVPSAYEAIG